MFESTGRATRPDASTVSDVIAASQQVLGHLTPFWVRGEISNWRRYGSGHCYFTLKDDSAQLRCVMFRSHAERLPAQPEDGMEVLLYGSVGLYPARGDFQLTASRLQATDAGGLWKLAFEKLRAKLDAEGLLEPFRKRHLPAFPECVGVVTSPDGAALQDFLHVLGRRAPWLRVIIAPSRVQGDGAAREIARGIQRLAADGRAELIVITRGGGSVEDLWSFNEEIVARAVVGSPVPVVSAVGHETDISISDLVADVRAPTPSAAAEIISPDAVELERALSALPASLARSLVHQVERKAERLARLEEGLGRAVHNGVEGGERRLSQLAGLLHALSPLAALSRGFAVPMDAEGRILRCAADFEVGTDARMRVHDGNIDVQIRRVLEIPSSIQPVAE